LPIDDSQGLQLAGAEQRHRHGLDGRRVLRRPYDAAGPASIIRIRQATVRAPVPVRLQGKAAPGGRAGMTKDNQGGSFMA